MFSNDIFFSNQKSRVSVKSTYLEIMLGLSTLAHSKLTSGKKVQFTQVPKFKIISTKEKNSNGITLLQILFYSTKCYLFYLTMFLVALTLRTSFNNNKEKCVLHFDIKICVFLRKQNNNTSNLLLTYFKKI